MLFPPSVLTSAAAILSSFTLFLSLTSANFPLIWVTSTKSFLVLRDVVSPDPSLDCLPPSDLNCSSFPISHLISIPIIIHCDPHSHLCDNASNHLNYFMCEIFASFDYKDFWQSIANVVSL